MRLHRFYVNKPLGEELVVESVGEEKEILHQLRNVFRYKSGDEVFLFSPRAPRQDFLYRIESISPKASTLAFLGIEENIQAYPATLAMSLVKKDTFETIVRHATELGIARIIPVVAERSEKKSLNFERLNAIAREASEQCGRGTIPEIVPISSLEEAFLSVANAHSVVGSLHGTDLSRIAPKQEHSDICIWIGPEGGWTEKEEGFFQERGASLLRTVDTVMRADTAAINIASLALSHFFLRR